MGGNLTIIPFSVKYGLIILPTTTHAGHHQLAKSQLLVMLRPQVCLISIRIQNNDLVLRESPFYSNEIYTKQLFGAFLASRLRPDPP